MINSKLQTGLRTMMVLVAACAAVAWSWRHLAESNRLVTTDDFIRAIYSGSLDERTFALRKLQEAKPSESAAVMTALTHALDDKEPTGAH